MEKTGMNILFLYASGIDPIRGGVQRVTHVLAGWFESRGLRVFFLSRTRAEGVCDPRQFYLPEPKCADSAVNRAYYIAFLREHGIDIVVNQGGRDPGISALAAYARGKESVFLISVIHNSLLAPIMNFHATYATHKFAFLAPLASIPVVHRAILAAYRLKYGRHYRRLCAASDAVVLLSEGFRGELAFFLGRGRRTDNVLALANPVSFGAEQAVRPKERMLLYVGRIDTTQKRVDLLVDVWRKLCGGYPDWSLRVVGDGPQLPLVKEMAQGLANIRFEGFCDPGPWYARAAVLCMTSSFEGFPMVLPEAMAHGVVPVAFRSYASVTDIIDDGVNGMLVPPFDTDAYAARLASLMDDDARREEMARAAAEKSKSFSLESIGQKWLALFDSLRTGPARGGAAGKTGEEER